MTEPLLIAIDGPAAAGKGTLASRLAAHYGLPHLDTGLLYRAIGKIMAERGLDLDDAAAATAVARALVPADLSRGDLRGREAGELASRVAVHEGVRAALVDFQRAFAADPRGAVLDGRDIGTVICPDAPVKFFVTASAEVRARRRTDELAAKGRSVVYGQILAEVRERDDRDMNRAQAPLRPAADAIVIDTSSMGPDEVLGEAIAAVAARVGA
jgi:cytidylate kinase